ncbi:MULTISPECIES: efflux RND transporter periplasmic adaptor subunit [unclassified Caulobacter]|uniref:efflux RND transporter periplasmic adaptor subunit n=1 Tax=unclassified Caulobacter TaxID=2648921 RepID=UPI000D3B53E8|nr:MULTISPECIES: efflux RND transporter periplasmic adaptor subunit [unclassified Caulobacter]PTS87148.1 efflux RND transporter periplasmic adaptor subunit [Caulobacter sp. HMWF009]PTT05660.1 efflux RND transporter periplasmic adaptor subunit [Caulobacter sp. HMWF025]
MRRSSPPTLKALRGLLVMSATLPLLAGCGGKDKTPKAQAPATPVEAVAVSGPKSEAQVSGTGTLERRREMALSFRIGGVLTRMAVEAGDSVRAGQALAAIDPANLEARQQQTSADLERARRDVERDRTLFDKGYVSRQRLDDRLSALKAAEAAYSSTSFDRRWAQLTSPVSGVVLARNAQAGEVVQPGQVVLKVADLTSPLVLRLPLSARDAGRVRVGDAARVRVAEMGEQALNGTVTRLGEAADTRTGAVTVEIELSGRPDLRSGQIASAELSVRTAPERTGAFARIPAEAVLEAEGARAFVLRLDGGIARRTAVGFGGFDGDDALVSGLADGAQVITAGAGFVGDGEKVRLVDPAKLPSTTAGSR